MKIKGKVQLLKGKTIIGKRACQRGETAFYVRTSKKKGLKIFYGLTKKVLATRKRVRQIHKNMQLLHKRGVAVKPYRVTSAKIDIEVGGKRVVATVPAIVVRHCSRKKPDKAFDRFVRKVRRITRETGISYGKDSFKPVNIMFDNRVGGWRLVDVK